MSFWRDLAERAVRTGAQAGLGVLAGSSVLSMDWPQAGAIIATAMFSSVMMSLAGGKVGDPATAGFARAPKSPINWGLGPEPEAFIPRQLIQASHVVTDPVTEVIKRVQDPTGRGGL